MKLSNSQQNHSYLWSLESTKECRPHFGNARTTVLWDYCIIVTNANIRCQIMPQTLS